MRLLESENIPFQVLEYEVDESDLSGEHAAEMVGYPVEQIFKTLVLKGEKTGHFVCCIPSHEELDLKKVAKAVKDKKVEMIPMKELLGITGYVRGGCSPIGMKKKLPTLMDETAVLFDLISVSAGQRGVMMLLNPEALAGYIEAEFYDLTKDGAL